MNFRIFAQPEMRKCRAPRPSVEVCSQSAAIFPSFPINYRNQTGLRLSYALCGKPGKATLPLTPHI
jgi:hypothetical protein